MLIDLNQRTYLEQLKIQNKVYLLDKPFTLLDIYKSLLSVTGYEHLLSIENTPEDPGQQADISWLSKRKILVVEDDPTNQMITKEMLSKLKIDIDIVSNGSEAVSAVYNHPYDAILMDINTPMLNGYEATKQIRSDRQFAPIPIIGMSAYTLQEHKEKALSAGMNAYITKPFGSSQLFEMLSQHLSGIPKNTDSPVNLNAEETANLPIIKGVDI